MLKPLRPVVILLHVKRPGIRALARVGVAAALLVLALLLTVADARGSTGTGNGVGVYPSVVNFSNSLRGGDYLETIGLINGSPRPRVFRFSLAGPMARWLSVIDDSVPYSRLSSVTIPPGTTTVELRLEVPPRTANGSYSGALDVLAEAPKGPYPKGATPVSVSVVVAVTARVTGTQVIAGTLISVSSYPAIEVGDILPVFSRIRNSSNVVVAPVYKLRISRGSTVVYDNTSLGEGIPPGTLAQQQVEWPGTDTRSQPLGRYEVQLSVLFGQLSLGTRSLSFQLDPYGYLHRSGRLLGLELLNKPKLGDAADIGAVLVNTGAVQADSRFVGRLYRNGALVRGVTSYQLLLLPGTRGVATLVVNLPSNGLYRLTGVGDFAGAESNALTLSFQVGSSPFPVLYPILGAAGVLLCVGFWLSWRRPRPPRRSAPPLRSYVSNGDAPRRFTAARSRGVHAKAPRSEPRHERGSPGRANGARGAHARKLSSGDKVPWR
jgi:hypothetical protein